MPRPSQAQQSGDLAAVQRASGAHIGAGAKMALAKKSAVLKSAAATLKSAPAAKPKSKTKATDAKTGTGRKPLNKIKNPRLRRYTFLLRQKPYMKRLPTHPTRAKISYLMQRHNESVGASALPPGTFQRLLKHSASRILQLRKKCGLTDEKGAAAIQVSKRSRTALNNVVWSIFKCILSDAATIADTRYPPTERVAYQRSGKVPRIRLDDLQTAVHMNSQPHNLIGRHLKADMIRWTEEEVGHRPKGLARPVAEPAATAADAEEDMDVVEEEEQKANGVESDDDEDDAEAAAPGIQDDEEDAVSDDDSGDDSGDDSEASASADGDNDAVEDE